MAQSGGAKDFLFVREIKNMTAKKYFQLEILVSNFEREREGFPVLTSNQIIFNYLEESFG